MTFALVHLVRVIDGDTVVLDFELGFDVTTTVHCRLFGINAPELHDPDPVVRARAEAAKSHLSLLLVAPIGATVNGQDKYGRWLVWLTSNGVNVNQAMIDGGFAVKYP